MNTDNLYWGASELDIVYLSRPEFRKIMDMELKDKTNIPEAQAVGADLLAAARNDPKSSNFFEDAKLLKNIKVHIFKFFFSFFVIFLLITSFDSQVKKHYNKDSCRWSVYLCKDNRPPYKPSIIQLSVREVGDSIKILRSLIDEVFSTPKGQIIKRLHHPKAVITDYKNPEFWDPAIAEKTQSGRLEVRVIRNSNAYDFRLMSRRPPNEEYGPTWLGVTMLMSLQEAIMLFQELKSLGTQMHEDETDRLLQFWTAEEEDLVQTGFEPRTSVEF